MSLDQRETLVFLEAPVVPEETDLTEALDPKESLVCLVSLELEDHLDPLPPAPSESQDPPDPLDQSDHQDTPEETEARVTPVPQVWISLDCLETEDHLVSMVLQDPLDLQGLPEAQGGTACLVCQELKETWAQWDLLDQLEAQVDLEDLVALDKKVKLDSPAEMVFQDL